MCRRTGYFGARMNSPLSHQSVLLEETVQAVLGSPDGVYVDATFGRGGHSRRLLSLLAPSGRVIAFDKDPEAVAEARRLEAEDSRFRIVHDSFASLGAVMDAAGLSGQVAGVMADLGVSSPQLDDPLRGFSFQADGPLDMRMDTTRGESAADWLARTGESELADVLFQYGEERYSRRIARAIKQSPEPVLRTRQLAEIVAAAHPAWERHKHPATRSFQAIRIAVNAELADVERFLPQALAVLRPGGRLAVISFHSLEDRLVKRFFQRQSRGDDLPRDLPVRAADLQPRLRILGKTDPTAEEIRVNARARSAHLRVAEKLEMQPS